MSDVSVIEKEQKYYCYYLLLLTTAGILLLAIIFLRKMESPFSNDLAYEMQQLKDEKKMNELQQQVAPALARIFDKIDSIPVNIHQGTLQTDLLEEIRELSNISQRTDLNDIRKNSYRQLAGYMDMYVNDKRIAIAQLQNISELQRQFKECEVGYQNKQQQLSQKLAAISARSN